MPASAETTLREQERSKTAADQTPVLLPRARDDESHPKRASQERAFGRPGKRVRPHRTSSPAESNLRSQTVKAAIRQPAPRSAPLHEQREPRRSPATSPRRHPKAEIIEGQAHETSPGKRGSSKRILVAARQTPHPLNSIELASVRTPARGRHAPSRESSEAFSTAPGREEPPFRLLCAVAERGKQLEASEKQQASSPPTQLLASSCCFPPCYSSCSSLLRPLPAQPSPSSPPSHRSATRTSTESTPNSLCLTDSSPKMSKVVYSTFWSSRMPMIF